jgi:dTDP-4-amino-4,6-dideoxygalactose transaminase
MQARPSDEIWNYQQIRLGFNYRMTDVQAALGLTQLTRLEEFLAKRHSIAGKYDAAFAQVPLITPWQHPDTYSSYHLYPVRIRRAECGRSQREVYDELTRSGIAANLHYIPVYRQPYYEAMGFRAGYCPQAEQYHKETLSLPMFPGLAASDQDRVIETLRGFLTR